MNKKIAFTIVAQNYISFAAVLAESMKKSNHDTDFIIFIADGISDELQIFANENELKIRDALKIDNKKFMEMAFYYEVTEYCTSIKPFIFNQLINDGYELISYIDPDIYVYQNLYDSIYANLETHNMILTPHICTPINDNKIPSEADHLKTGTYNLGFISLKATDESSKFIKWWMNKCENKCFNDPIKGLFVDQKWINLVPGMFDGVYISKHLGLNVAYWNFHEREMVEGKINNKFPLVFFHFSGITLDEINLISKYQNRFTLESREDLRQLFEEYARKIKTNKAKFIKSIPYYFNSYPSGKSISLLARKVYFWNKNNLSSPLLNVESEEKFRQILKSYHLSEDSVAISGKLTTDEINKKAAIVNFLLRNLHRIIGTGRYLSLCKYFQFLASLDNHKFLEKNIDVVDK